MTLTDVAQCSAIGVSVAATPPCSVICFGRIVSRNASGTSSTTTPPLQSYVCSSLSRTLRTQLQQGGGTTDATQSFGGVQGDIPATSLKLRESAATLCAQHCVPRLGSQYVCATKDPHKSNTHPIEGHFVICILHTVSARVRHLHLHRRVGSSRHQKECLPCIVGPLGMRVLRPPALH